MHNRHLFIAYNVKNLMVDLMLAAFTYMWYHKSLRANRDRNVGG